MEITKMKEVDEKRKKSQVKTCRVIQMSAYPQHGMILIIFCL